MAEKAIKMQLGEKNFDLKILLIWYFELQKSMTEGRKIKK
jgi:hypothetical protein